MAAAAAGLVWWWRKRHDGDAGKPGDAGRSAFKFPAGAAAAGGGGKGGKGKSNKKKDKAQRREEKAQRAEKRDKCGGRVSWAGCTGGHGQLRSTSLGMRLLCSKKSGSLIAACRHAGAACLL